jgi:hypothetical protein
MEHTHSGGKCKWSTVKTERTVLDKKITFKTDYTCIAIVTSDKVPTNKIASRGPLLQLHSMLLILHRDAFPISNYIVITKHDGSVIILA